MSTAERSPCVERLGHQGGDRAEQVLAELGGLGPAPAGALALEQAARSRGDRGLGGEELEGGEALGGERAGDEVVLEVEQGDGLWRGRGRGGRARSRGWRWRSRDRPANRPGVAVGGVEQDGLAGALDVGEERPRDAGVAGQARGPLDAGLGGELERVALGEGEGDAAGAALLEHEPQRACGTGGPGPSRRRWSGTP